MVGMPTPATLRRRAAAVAVLVLAAYPLAACTKEPEPGSALDALAAGWPTGNWEGKVSFVKPDNTAISAADVGAAVKALSGALTQPAVKANGKPVAQKDTATGKLDFDWALPGGAHWKYTTDVKLSKGKEAWQVVWEPKIVHPDLQDGAVLATNTLAPKRGDIVDAQGTKLVTLRPVVVVGIQPRLVKDMASLTALLNQAFKKISVDVDLSGLAKEVADAKPDAFVEVVSLRRELYDQIRSDIRDLDGTVFREEMRQLAPSRAFGRALFGSVGDVTKEIMDANPNKYAIGDQVGLGGLEKAYDDRLRGTSGVEVVITSKASDGTQREQVKVYTAPAVDGQDLKVSLDSKVQNAADAALGTLKGKRTAIVAIRISDGQVLAVANGPDGGGENLAFTAQVPPGSTFKVVTAYGVLDNDSVTMNTTVACPKTLTVDGRVFHNAHDFELGSVPLHTDLAKSCNTAFASLAPKLGPTGLATAATALGIGTKWDLGADAFSGAVSSGGTAAEQAAAAFGQGTTVVSPAAMAGAIAAVARGQWKQPVLMLDPAPASPAPDGPALKDTTLTPLRAALREAVTAGTGTQLKSTPGGAVSGKTGTAEFDANPAHTHSWFIGWQGDIAFAVFVENGGDSTATAVPLADKFLRALR
jgi:cell division protein FtsI/penicillin-binding protein 2